MYCLKQFQHEYSNHPVYIILDEEEKVIGRRELFSATGQKYEQASLAHAAFYKRLDGPLLIKDLNSDNGTYVNDVKISTSLTPLSSGDVVGFGVKTENAQDGFVCIVIKKPPDHMKRKKSMDLLTEQHPTDTQGEHSGTRKTSCEVRVNIKAEETGDPGANSFVLRNQEEVIIAQNIPVVAAPLQPKPCKMQRRTPPAFDKDESPEEMTSQKAPANFTLRCTSSAGNLRKKPTVKIRPERFSSRMGFLINDLEQKDKKESTASDESHFTETSFPENPSTTSSKKFDSSLSNLTNLGLKSLQPQNSEHIDHNTLEKSTPQLIASGKTCAEEDNSLSSSINEETLIKKIIKLDIKKLQEQVSLEGLSSDGIASVSTLPLHYKSYESYSSSFLPMIFREILGYIYTELKASNKQFLFSVLSYNTKGDSIQLNCESVVKENNFVPQTGMVAIMEIKENAQMCSPLIGYIYTHKINPFDKNLLKNPNWKKQDEQLFKNARHCTFGAYISKKENALAFNSIMNGRGICYIRNKLRLADALHSIKDSPLLQAILQPSITTFFTTCIASSSNSRYTCSQMEVINGISFEINKPQVEPKIMLVHGPPGTGKTHTIIGLLEMLFYNRKFKSNLKILITAPSDVAIDEIGCSLIHLNDQFSFKDSRIKFVRVGVKTDIHPQMMPYFLGNKARVMQQKKSKEFKTGRPLNETDYYCDIITESHIVLSTLRSCGTWYFKPNSNLIFSCCIVDKSTKCTEMELLQPLMFGISKLVLVGDLEQLPTTIVSKNAMQCDLSRSMFERFHLYVQSIVQNPACSF